MHIFVILMQDLQSIMSETAYELIWLDLNMWQYYLLSFSLYVLYDCMAGALLSQ